MDAESRMDFALTVAFANYINPSMSDKQIADLMPSSPPSLPAAGAMTGYTKPYGNFHLYDTLVAHWEDIEKSAKKHDIDIRVLTAVLIYEHKAWRNQWGALGDSASMAANVFNGSEKASVGIGQMEIYKARMMLAKRHGKEWLDKRKYPAKHIFALLIGKPALAIDLAAAWIQHLKEEVWYMKDGIKHYLDDEEAGIAYCGCSGVTVNLDNNYELQFKNFQIWMQGGKLESGSHKVGVARRSYLESMGAPGSLVDEFWSCARERCYARM